MFAFKERIHSDSFEEVVKKGKTTHSPLFSLCYLKAENKAFAVVASKKVSKEAVIRNRNKRRVRHALKQFSTSLQNGYYIVFVKRDLSAVPYSEIKEGLSKIML